MNSLKKLVLILALLFVSASALLAAPLNIVWYTAGVYTDAHKTTLNTLASSNSWSPITFWDPGTALPNFNNFDLLVVASMEGPWTKLPDYFDLVNSGLTGSSFGTNVMLTGQDADWHYLVDASPGPSNFDGPQGVIVNGINWAGSSTGLGAVIFQADAGFDLFGLDQGFRFDYGTENVKIPLPSVGHPVNAGLTSSGLSNWGFSSHTGWVGTDTTKWTPLNADGDFCTVAGPNPPASSCVGPYVTLVRGAAVPEPATLLLLGPSLLGLAFAYRRKKTS